jgi:hypothetical protein
VVTHRRVKEQTMTTITLHALLEVLLEMPGTFVLCNAHGSIAQYETFVTTYGTTLHLAAPSATA